MYLLGWAVAEHLAVTFPALLFLCNATLSVMDDGCVEFEGQLVCKGPFPYFKLVAFVAIVGFGAAIEGVARSGLLVLCPRSLYPAAIYIYM